MSRRLPLGMIFSSSRGENPINFSTLGVGAHGRSLRNRVSRRVFYDAEKEHNCQDPNILCKPITGLIPIIDASSTLIINENYSTATFTVRLNKAPLKNTTVSLVVNDLTEANVSQDEIVFTRDNYHRPVTVTVTGQDDQIIDGTINTFISVKIIDEELTKFVYISNEDNDAGDQLLIITGIDNRTIDADEGISTTENVNFKLSADPGIDMTFNATNSSSDISMDKNSLTFTSENWHEEQTIEFTINKPENNLADGDISSNVVFDNGNGAVTNVTVVFSDNDILDSNINVGEGLLYEDSTLSVDVSLDKIPISDVSLSIVSSDSARVSVSPSLLEFTPENYNATQSFVLSGIDNGILNNPELFDISLTFVNGGNDNVTYNYQKSISVTMYDSTREVFFPISSPTINEGSSVSYDLSLSTRPVNDLVVSFASGTHIQSINPVTFTNENWNLAQTITLTTNTSSQAVDQDDTLVINTTNNDFGSQSMPVVISNVNSTADFTLSKTTSTLTEGSSDTFTVVLTSEPSSETTMSIANVDVSVATDLTSLVFNNTNWSVPQTVTVTTTDDSLVNGDRTDTITVGVASGATEYDSLSPKTLILTIQDNDSAPVVEINTTTTELTMSEGLSETFDLSLSSQPSGDVTMSFTLSANGYSTNDLGFNNLPGLTITDANWNIDKTTTLDYPNVDRYYNDISVNLELASTGGGYDGITTNLLINLINTDIPIAEVDLSQNISVTVADDGNGNKYYIDDDNDATLEYAPTLTLLQGSGYRFTQVDATNATHQLHISESANGTHDGGSEYAVGTKYKGTVLSPEFTEFVVPIDNTLDKLYYYCVNHAGMGGNILLARDYNSGAGYYFDITVADIGNGNTFYINGLEQESIVLLPGTTYYFDQSEASNASHPLKFATTTDGTELTTTAGSYTITTTGTTAGTDLITAIVIDAGYTGSNLFYACQNHNGMGGSLKYLH